MHDDYILRYGYFIIIIIFLGYVGWLGLRLVRAIEHGAFKSITQIATNQIEGQIVSQTETSGSNRQTRTAPELDPIHFKDKFQKPPKPTGF